MTPKVGEMDRIAVEQAPGYGQVAVPLLHNGFSPIPVPPATKATRMRNWPARCACLPSVDKIGEESLRYPEHGTAVACGEIVALDLDWSDRALIERACAFIQSVVPGLILVREGQSPRVALFCRAAEPIPTRHGKGYDIQSTGTYMMVFGIHPVTKRPYLWIGPSPLDVRLEDLAPITATQVNEIKQYLDTLSGGAVDAVQDGPHGVDESDLVADGRDRELRDIVLRVWVSGTADVDALAAEAWRQFEESVDLTRPKRNGPSPWTYKDAHQKAVYLLKRVAEGKISPASMIGQKLTYLPKYEPFAHAIDALGARGEVPKAGVRLSQLMLCLCRGDEGCFASAETLARVLDLAPTTVKRMRSLLVTRGLWARQVRGGGRGKRTCVVPCLATALGEAEKVTDLGTWSTSEEGEKADDFSEASLEEQNSSEHIFSFEFLADWTSGDPA